MITFFFLTFEKTNFSPNTQVCVHLGLVWPRTEPTNGQSQEGRTQRTCSTGSIYIILRINELLIKHGRNGFVIAERDHLMWMKTTWHFVTLPCLNSGLS